MLSWAHLRDLLNQQALVAPIVLPSLAWLTLWRWWMGRTRPATQTTLRAASQVNLRGDVRRFWQIAAVCHLLLIAVWNPDYGGQRDWDLFSLASIATTLWLIASLHRHTAADVAANDAETNTGISWIARGFAPLIALQLWHTAAWIYQNTLPWSWP